MATNLAIDDELIREAQKISGHRTKKAAVTEASPVDGGGRLRLFVRPGSIVSPSEYRQVLGTVTREPASGSVSIGKIFARKLDKELKL